MAIGLMGLFIVLSIECWLLILSLNTLLFSIAPSLTRSITYSVLFISIVKSIAYSILFNFFVRAIPCSVARSTAHSRESINRSFCRKVHHSHPWWRPWYFPMHGLLYHLLHRALHRALYRWRPRKVRSFNRLLPLCSNAHFNARFFIDFFLARSGTLLASLLACWISHFVVCSLEASSVVTSPVWSQIDRNTRSLASQFADRSITRNQTKLLYSKFSFSILCDCQGFFTSLKWSQ